MFKFFSIVLVSAACCVGEAVPVCSAVTQGDAQLIIGASAKRTNDPSECQWADAGGKKKMNVARLGTSAAFESYRAHSAKAGKTSVENGLGGTAFSTIPSAHHGGRAAIYVVKGPAILVVDIDGFDDGAAEQRLPEVRDLVRKLVPKL
jgi:hypothetical protein